MRLITGRSASVKLTVVGAAVVMLMAISLLGIRPRADAASSGPSPSFTNAPSEANCTLCHGDFPVNSGTGSVQITGVPAAYSLGQPVQITVRVAQADAVIYGFQMTAVDSNGDRAGTFAPPVQNPPEMQVVNGLVIDQMGEHNRQYIEHTTEGIIPTMLGSRSWTFTWTAPSQPRGRIDFYVAGNAANSDGSSSGDYIYTASAASLFAGFSVGGRVTTPTGAGLRNAIVTLTDQAGVTRSVVTSSFGFYTFENVPGGQTYTVRVTSKRYRFSPQSAAVNGNLTDVNFSGVE